MKLLIKMYNTNNIYNKFYLICIIDMVKILRSNDDEQLIMFQVNLL